MKISKILIFLFLLFIPNLVMASNVDYEITNYYINADILTNGDLSVTEVIVLDGTFHGYERDIYFRNMTTDTNDSNYQMYNATDLELQKIEAKYIDEPTNDLLVQNDYDLLISNRAFNGGYIYSNYSNGSSYKMYYQAEKQKVAFRISYVLKDVIVAHQDVGELYWTFIGEDYPDVINDLQIKINLPQNDNSSNFRAWAHGDLSGKIDLVSHRSITATVPELEPNSSVDIRSTFDLSLLDVDAINKQSNKEALSTILLEEEQRAHEANQERKAMQIKYYGILVGTILWFIVLVIMWIHVYLKYDKEYKSDFKAKYYRDFIDDYNVEVIDYLFHQKITENAMSASIMNLIYKKNIRVEEIPGHKKKKEYTFYLENDANTNDTEKCLLDFLFNQVGSDNQFTTKDLQEYAKNPETCESFQGSYTAWKNSVIVDAKKENFFENQTKPKIISLVLLLIIIFLNILKGMFFVQNKITFIALIVGIIFFLYTLFFSKRTLRGNDHYLKWTAFKNFLNDFAAFDVKELPEITLWQRYMVYATLFGLADKVSKAMNVKIKEMTASGLYTLDYLPTFYDYYFYHSLYTNFNRALHSNQEAVAAITAQRASSTFSSGSGNGGGFSSGGGYGGGGGGGRGF